MFERVWGPAAPTKPRLAKSLRVLGLDVDDQWPDRSKRSDGWIGDAAHKERQSDHNPDPNGIVHAIDITADGVRPWAVVVAALLHPSTEYVIWDGSIWHGGQPWHRQPYTGPDPHTTHVHVSIKHTRRAETRRRHWLPDLGPTAVVRAALRGR